MKMPKKSMLYYYIGIFLLIMVLNAAIFPLMSNNAITQVDYGTFLKQAKAGAIEKAEISENQIAYIVKEKDGAEKVYVTGRMEDPDLVNRLAAPNVIFSKVIPRENSPFCRSWPTP